MLAKRILESLAMAIIGDSVLCVLSPRRHVSLWLDGPRWWRRSTEPFARHPDLTRALGLMGVGFGLWLAWRQEPRVELEEAAQAKLPRRLARQLEELAR